MKTEKASITRIAWLYLSELGIHHYYSSPPTRPQRTTATTDNVRSRSYQRSLLSLNQCTRLLVHHDISPSLPDDCRARRVSSPRATPTSRGPSPRRSTPTTSTASRTPPSSSTPPRRRVQSETDTGRASYDGMMRVKGTDDGRVVLIKRLCSSCPCSCR